MPLAAISDMSVRNRTDLVVRAVIGAGVLLEALTATSVRTAAGPHGVMVRFGVLGLPRCTCRLEQIAWAEVIDLPCGP